MYLPPRRLLNACFAVAVAVSLFTATGAEARSHGGALIAGAVAGAAVGVLAGSALAAPAPVYIDRALPPRPTRTVNIYHTEVWVDPSPHDWSESQVDDDDDDDLDDDE